MPGGLLQLFAYGQTNVILNGNPQKTFFKTVYKSYTQFGLQRFRIDYKGQRRLSYDSPVEMNFKLPRYADLVWDTYIVVNLPDIWSPIHYNKSKDGDADFYTPYEFQWIQNVGIEMIKQITIYSGGNTLAQYSGEWMMNAMRRDENCKLSLLGQMAGNDINGELWDPALYNKDSTGTPRYPSAVFEGDVAKPLEPSIRGRQLYIPLMAWFCNSTKTALPLIALQYQEIEINIEFRPVKELFTILEVKGDHGEDHCYKRRAPDSAKETDAMWHFLQQPPELPDNEEENNSLYVNKRTDWNADIHLISTYIFLGEEERRSIAAQSHSILIKTQFEWDYLNATGPRRVDIPSRDMISGYMWRFRRSDAHERNQWGNYQNYEWENSIPNEVERFDKLEKDGTFNWNKIDIFKSGKVEEGGNIKHIMTDMAILCGQDYRENVLPAGVYSFIEKWSRTTGASKEGLYCYNFCTDSNRLNYQPTGAQNTNKWKWITFEYNTIQPPKNKTITVKSICAGEELIGVKKDLNELHKYNFDLKVFEERYNMIEITGGRIGLMFAR